MRSSRLSRIIAAAAAAIVASTASPATAASAATPTAGTVINLPTAQYFLPALVVDSRHNHIFLSMSQTVMVLDLAGHPVKTIDAVASELTMSPDGRTLYGAGDTVVAIDTATLAVTAEYPTTPGYRIEGITPMVTIIRTPAGSGWVAIWAGVSCAIRLRPYFLASSK